MSDDHEWCRDVRRDEAVRAAEDAAAVQSIQHRDLPEQVALLWASLGDIIGRVVRLEGEMDAGQDEEAAPAEGMRKERGESVRVVEEVDAASDEAVAHGATLNALVEARESLAAANRGIARLTAERDAAIRERDEARAECKMLLAERDEATGRCKMMLDRVAELEGAAAPAANAGGEDNSEPVAWGVLMTPGSKVWRCSSEKQAQKCVDHFGTGTVVPLYAAPQPRRWWLTEEERALIESLRETFEQNADAMRTHGLGGHVDNWERRVRLLDAILARETPPKVKVPNLDDLEEAERPVWVSACEAWIDAIRAAGWDVEE